MPFKRNFLLRVLLCLTIISNIAPGATRASYYKINWDEVQREALDLFIQYLKIDTTNPPGNEVRAAEFFADICKREGIEHQLFEPFPGRSSVWARLRGDGSKRPIILLNHTDVVPYDKEFWTVGAFSGAIKDGFIYGRGAMDMKSLGMAQFVTLLTLKRAQIPLKRDVIFLATADEEAGGLNGAGWFAKNHRELIAGAEFLFNEGGANVVDPNGRVLAIGVGPSEKAPAWLRLTATGESGHGSTPRPNSSVNRLLRALNRLLDYTPPIRLAPVVEQSFQSIAPLAPPAQAAKYADIREAIKDPEFLRQLESEPFARAIIRNTISITVLQGSNKINVIPPAAYAEIDTRLAPGEKLDRWIAELRGVIKDDSIKIEPILSFEANASPTDSDLVKAVASVSKQRYPEAIVTYPVLAGFTDSHYFRDLGVMSYGFSPFVAPPRELGGGYHGNDEHIGKEAYVEGVRFFYEVVERLAR
ncbi:MAG TPA: M20/M25/M40 family metallo-hydrolase [Blastocatellia bacterium]|jgi:acetylornithine deacetylase/succinyl-diaminopimelate desuccinylase-like protein|nr:M20/M25/M40 family metallo-hydrolase [Blastocatellia bacterium]